MSVPIIVRECLSCRSRFMQVPRPTMDKDLQAEEKSLTDDINNLTKKVCGDLAEHTYKLIVSCSRSI